MLKRKTKQLKSGEIIVSEDIKKKYRKELPRLFDIYPNGVSEIDIKAVRLEYQKINIKQLRKCIKLNEPCTNPQNMVVQLSLFGGRRNREAVLHEKIYKNLEIAKKEIINTKISLSNKTRYLRTEYLEITRYQYGNIFYPYILFDMENIYEFFYKKVETENEKYTKKQNEIIEKAKYIFEKNQLNPIEFCLPIKKENGKYVYSKYYGKKI